jgi:hypothetical protein
VRRQFGQTGCAAAFPAQAGRVFAWYRLADDEHVFGYLLSMKSLDGGPSAFRGNHGYEAEAAPLLMGAFNHDINVCDIAVSGKELLELALCGGCGDIINMYFGGHNRFQSLSQIFIRVAYPVEPFGFKFVSSHPLTFLFNGHRDGLRQQPDLFGKLNNGQADEFQMVH